MRGGRPTCGTASGRTGDSRGSSTRVRRSVVISTSCSPRHRIPRHRRGVERQGRVPLALRAHVLRRSHATRRGARAGHRPGGRPGRVARPSIVRRRDRRSHAARADPSRHHTLVPVHEHLRVPDLRPVRRRSPAARPGPALADRQAPPRTVRRGHRHTGHSPRHRRGHRGEGERGHVGRTQRRPRRPHEVARGQRQHAGTQGALDRRVAPGRSEQGRLRVSAIVADFRTALGRIAGWIRADPSKLPADCRRSPRRTGKYKYTSSPIPFRDFPFGSPWRLGFGTTSSNRKDGQRAIQLFSSKGRYNNTGVALHYTDDGRWHEGRVQRQDRGSAVRTTLVHDYDPGPPTALARCCRAVIRRSPWPDFTTLGCPATRCSGSARSIAVASPIPRSSSSPTRRRPTTCSPAAPSPATAGSTCKRSSPRPVSRSGTRSCAACRSTPSPSRRSNRPGRGRR